MRKAYDDQVTSMIDSFVQMWMKFEEMLHKELAKTHQFDNSDGSDLTYRDGDYGLFYRVGSVLYSQDPVTMGDLSSALSVPFSKATRIANWLVDSGYLERLPDSDDRRIVRVALTKKGQELYLATSIYMRDKVQGLLTSSLTAEEKMILITLINKVASVLKQVAS